MTAAMLDDNKDTRFCQSGGMKDKSDQIYHSQIEKRVKDLLNSIFHIALSLSSYDALHHHFSKVFI